MASSRVPFSIRPIAHRRPMTAALFEQARRSRIAQAVNLSMSADFHRPIIGSSLDICDCCKMRAPVRSDGCVLCLLLGKTAKRVITVERTTKKKR